VKGRYDAPAHGITGIAFDIDTVPVGGHLHLASSTQGTLGASASLAVPAEYWSPMVLPGYQETRWPEVGGPGWASSSSPFDPTRIESVWFTVESNGSSAVDYSFCIKNVTALTN
jgi:hypothetical protein